MNLKDLEERMNKAIETLEAKFINIRAGRANTNSICC